MHLHQMDFKKWKMLTDILYIKNKKDNKLRTKFLYDYCERYL